MGPQGQAAGSWAHWGHDKAPFSSGTRPRSEPPSGRGTRLPHSCPFQWPAVLQRCGPDCSPVWAHSGGRAGPAQAEGGARSSCPQGERPLEPCREGGGVLLRAGPSVPRDHTGLATQSPRASGLRGKDGELPFFLAPLQGPGQAPQPLREPVSGLENRESRGIWSCGGCKVAARVNGDVVRAEHLRTAGQTPTREEVLVKERLFVPRPLPPGTSSHEWASPWDRHAVCGVGWVGAHEHQCSTGRPPRGPEGGTAWGWWCPHMVVNKREEMGRHRRLSLPDTASTRHPAPHRPPPSPKCSTCTSAAAMSNSGLHEGRTRAWDTAVSGDSGRRPTRAACNRHRLWCLPLAMRSPGRRTG